MPLPIVAVVGRPNVGKSTFVNRIAQADEAIVHEMRGVTRDRSYHEADWNGVHFTLVDTGGIEMGDDDAFQGSIRAQAFEATREADVIVFLVDGRTGINADDEEVARILRKADKPVFLVVNKLDTPNKYDEMWEFYQLGLGDPWPVSSMHGHGTGDLLDEVVAKLQELDVPQELDDEPSVNVAIIGRPNAGKSSLTNKMTSGERSIVSDVAGTTRDAIDTPVVHDGKRYAIVDTAGLRRKSQIDEDVEYYGFVRAMRAIDRADVALLVVDSTLGLTDQDQRVAGYAAERGCAMVIVLNKWDLVEGPEAKADIRERIADRMTFVGYAPVVAISALTGKRVDRIWEAIDQAYASYCQTIPTNRLNTWLADIRETGHTVSNGKAVLRMKYVTQTGTRPPRFTFFVNRSGPGERQLRAVPGKPAARELRPRGHADHAEIQEEGLGHAGSFWWPPGVFVAAFLLGSIPWGLDHFHGVLPYRHTRSTAAATSAPPTPCARSGKAGRRGRVSCSTSARASLSGVPRARGVLASICCREAGLVARSPRLLRHLCWRVAFLGCTWGHIFSPWLRLQGRQGHRGGRGLPVRDVRLARARACELAHLRRSWWRRRRYVSRRVARRRGGLPVLRARDFFRGDWLRPSRMLHPRGRDGGLGASRATSPACGPARRAASGRRRSSLPERARIGRRALAGGAAERTRHEDRGHRSGLVGHRAGAGAGRQRAQRGALGAQDGGGPFHQQRAPQSALPFRRRACTRGSWRRRRTKTRFCARGRPSIVTPSNLHARRGAGRSPPPRTPRLPIVVCSKGVEEGSGLLPGRTSCAGRDGRPRTASPCCRGRTTPRRSSAGRAGRHGGRQPLGGHGRRSSKSCSPPEAFRTYTSDDVRGVELCAAFKNVIAIAVGLTYGHGVRRQHGGASC